MISLKKQGGTPDGEDCEQCGQLSWLERISPSGFLSGLPTVIRIAILFQGLWRRIVFDGEEARRNTARIGGKRFA